MLKICVDAVKVLESNSNTIVRVESNVPSDTLRIELFLSNYCNYKCWYCSPDSYGNTDPWPSFEKIKPGFEHLITHYKEKFGKKNINLFIGGGEPTVWPDLVKFADYFKNVHNCKINISTNGSRTLRWWKQNYQHFDHVRISVHNERADAKHIADVADVLYKGKVSVISSVLMDPNNWDQCLKNVEILKNSKYSWILTVSETIHPTINYTEEQREYIRKRVIRHSNLWYRYTVLRRKKPKYYNPSVEFENAEVKQIDTHEIILNKWNKFKGWSCDVGIDTLFINRLGDVTGACGEFLYGYNKKFNLYDENFIAEFNPEKQSTICTKELCLCQDEANVNKRIIPIKISPLVT